jgi:uncharacterized protein YjbI with pentapeptide repeats
MLIQIRNRRTADVIQEIEADNLKVAIELLIKRGADLGGADLREAHLREANLREAHLGGANLREAHLREANLREAHLRGADLGGANLGGANLRGADLRGANLRGANLRGAKGINKYLCTPLLLLLDQPSKIRAYKLINSKGEGPYNGGINYLKNHTFSVSDADINEGEQCGRGINLATLDWCIKEWQEDYAILIMEFTAADIAAIPTATDGKFRVHRCERVGVVDLKTVGLIN